MCCLLSCGTRCFVGKRRLEEAISEFKKNDSETLFEVIWRPFQLTPDESVTGVDKMSRLEGKFGKERLGQLIPPLKKVGESVGINFAFGGLVANTFNSHRLLDYVQKKKGVEEQNIVSSTFVFPILLLTLDQVMERLFKSYFEKEENIGDFKVLSASTSGILEQTEIETFLNSNLGVTETQKDLQRWKDKYQIQGVPFFIVTTDDGTEKFAFRCARTSLFVKALS